MSNMEPCKKHGVVNCYDCNYKGKEIDAKDRPIEEIKKIITKWKAKGFDCFVKWTCEKCGERCSSDEPNVIRDAYTHAGCGHTMTHLTRLGLKMAATQEKNDDIMGTIARNLIGEISDVMAKFHAKNKVITSATLNSIATDVLFECLFQSIRLELELEGKIPKGAKLRSSLDYTRKTADRLLSKVSQALEMIEERMFGVRNTVKIVLVREDKP